MLDALSQLDFLPPFRLQVNNRKLIQGFYTGLGIGDVDEVMRIIDKLDKMPVDAVRGLLVDEVGLSADQADRCLALADICTPDDGFVAQVRALGVTHPLLDEGLSELAELVRGCAPLVTDRVKIVADLKIARGLDYYTGTVFETRLEGSEGLGSICSGGRYDALASDGRTTYPGVGISLGVSRVLVPLLNRGVLEASRSVPSAVLVALVDEESRPASDAIAAALRANGVPCEVAASAARFGKQIRYAERRGIPYVWFTNAEGGHEVKDIRSGEQTSADPTTWTPPAGDLRPSVVSTGSTTEQTSSTTEQTSSTTEQTSSTLSTGDGAGRPATKEQHQ
jgi:histidyl-tRNA synthetase